MLEFAQKGYVSTYHAYYAPPDGEGRIVISLTCLAVGMLGEVGGGSVGAAVSGAGQALNPDAKPFNPRGVLHGRSGVGVGSIASSLKALEQR